MNDNKIKKKTKSKVELTILFVAITLVVAMCYFCYYYVTNKSFDHSDTATWAMRGQFGDMFGAINAVFSGLAFAGIIFTIYLQRQELKSQRAELKLTRKEFKQQNKTLSRQRFETTFYYLITNHHNFLQQMKMETIRNSTDFGKERVIHIGTEAIELMNKLIKLPLSRLKLKTEILTDEQKAYMFKEYNFLIEEKENAIMLYVQSVTTVLSLIGNTELISEEERKLYFRILNSQVTPQEKTFIFYYMSCYRKERIGGAFFSTLHKLHHKFRFLTYSDVRLFDQSHVFLLKYWEEIYAGIDPK
jgi:hypothetical protein